MFPTEPACRNQEVIVSFQALKQHIPNLEHGNSIYRPWWNKNTAPSPHKQQVETRKKLRPNAVRVQHHAGTTAASCHRVPNNTSRALTPPKRRAVPMHSTAGTTGSSSGCIEDEDNPSSQCHQFPKLTNLHPVFCLQDSHLDIHWRVIISTTLPVNFLTESEASIRWENQYWLWKLFFKPQDHIQLPCFYMHWIISL